MPRLLIVHHTPSPTMETLLESLLAGARDEQVSEVDVVLKPALGASVPDVLESDGYILGTPANLGYMSGALKHFFDQIYYPCREATAGRPYGLYAHGNNDVDGAVRSVEKITTGLGWPAVSRPVRCIGDVTSGQRDACWELGATVAANLLL